ncbi:lantibiotic dehydratase [Kibdelosporangium persicum]|uniref:Lantibiotic dehydratase, C terminus n=1 Tax=Kibdelosporangium persicum TaxID=2698649 RepID=A0ABX2F6M4_9PSEU|nr:lantibiotic dehydratase [Kibdelosporangium persicum]NRN66542.1 Lantibiotic dehydratase, C terminus [Kibdelosporangium persicum]
MHITLPTGARVDGSFVVRTAGLPANALRQLRFAESFALVDRLAGDRAWLHAEGNALADELHAIIGTAGDADRPRLVGLRRALHRVRPPSGREWNEQIVAALPADVVDRVREWIVTLRTVQRVATALPDVFVAELAAKDLELRAVAARPQFQRALAHASPALSGELSKWLSGRRRPQRQSLIRLAKYVARAVAKTSPLSTFTVSGLGTWSEADDDTRQKPEGAVVGVTELDGGLLHLLTRGLRNDPRLSAAMPVRANPSITLHDDRVMFVGTTAREPVVSVPAAPVIRETLRILGDRTVPAADLVAELTEESAETPRVERFVDGLVDAGLLERLVPLPDLAPDPLGDLAAWLSRGGEPGTELAAAATGVRTLMGEAISVEDVDGNQARLSELHRAVGELAGLAGLDSPQTRERYQFRDNAVYRGTVVVEPISRWRTALSDLDVVRRWTGAFDVAMPWRLALGTYCGERFGPGSEIPFLLLHRAIHEERTRGEGAERTLAAEAVASMAANALVMLPTELVKSPLPRLRELVAIRREAGEAMRGHDPDDGVIRVDGGAVAELVARWPEWVMPPGSLGCYVQAIPDGEAVRLVLNVAQTGYGRGRSRVRQIITQAGEVAPPDGSWLSPGGEPVLAEVRGAFASSANRRPPSLPYEIDYPGVVSDRPSAERIRLGELVVVHDPRTDLVRLVWKRRGVQVRPVHLGMMSDVMLPPAARLLTYTFGAAHYLHTTALSMLSPIVESVGERQVVARPRVEVGRVVLQRARWVAREDAVPRRDKGETDANYWVRVTGWLRTNGIPLRCFVQMRTDEGPRAGNPFSWGFSKSRKPVYVDFANWYLVAVFERMLAGAGNVVVFAEALPDPEEAESHVTEYLVELSEPEHRDAG